MPVKDNMDIWDQIFKRPNPKWKDLKSKTNFPKPFNFIEFYDDGSWNYSIQEYNTSLLLNSEDNKIIKTSNSLLKIQKTVSSILGRSKQKIWIDSHI